MSCCNNKKYVDPSCVKTKEWEETDNLLGVTGCGSIVKVNKPLYELDEQDRDKLDALTVDGQGNKVLADDGTYKTPEQLGAVVNGTNSSNVAVTTPNGRISLTGREGVSISAGSGQNVAITGSDLTFNGESVLTGADIADAVTYDANDDIQPRSNIILKNGTSLSGKTTDGNTFKIASMTSSDGVDMGSTNVRTTIKSDTRPYVETKEGTERVAYQSELESAAGDLTELSGRVDDLETGLTQTNNRVQTIGTNLEALQAATTNSLNEVRSDLTGLRTDVNTNTENIAVNTQEIEALREDFNNEDHFKGYFETSAEIQRLPGSTGAYAWSAESGTVWIYDGNSWVNSGTPIPDQSVDASDEVPRMDGEATPGTSNRYARGDHRHPTDITRAAATDLDNYLPLAGNTQTTGMTGDIWLGSENKIRLSDSGNTYIEQVTESQQTQVVSTGVGGIDLISTNGTNKSNGKEIAVKEDVQTVAGDLSTLQSDYTAFKSNTGTRLSTAESTISNHENRISTNETNIATNTRNITRNTQDIAELKEEIDQSELFKGYFATNAEITALQGSRGAYAWSGESKTVWVYDADLLTWKDSGQPIPTEGTDPYNQNPEMDGTATPGNVLEYARGNHRHPTDTSRASFSDLQGVAARVTVNEGKITNLQTDVTDIAGRVEDLETEQGNFVPISGNEGNPMTGDLRLSNNTATKYNTSGTAQIHFSEDGAKLNIESPTAGGINLNTGDGPGTLNGEQIATENYVDGKTSEVQDNLNTLSGSFNEFRGETTENISLIDNNISSLDSRVSTAEGNISSQGERIANLETTVPAVQATANQNKADIDTLNQLTGTNTENISAIQGTVAGHDTRITANRADIDSLQGTITNQQHFKGFFTTNLEIQQIPGETGAFAWSGESGTIWVYNSDTPSWEDSGRPIPESAVAAADSEPLMDGEVQIGQATTYARADHRHPTDTSRAAQDDLTVLENRVTTTESELSQVQSQVNDLSTDLSDLSDRAGNTETDVQDIKGVTVWGRPLSGDVTGNITGVGNIYPSGDGVQNIGSPTNKIGNTYSVNTYVGRLTTVGAITNESTGVAIQGQGIVALSVSEEDYDYSEARYPRLLFYNGGEGTATTPTSAFRETVPGLMNFVSNFNNRGLYIGATPITKDFPGTEKLMVSGNARVTNNLIVSGDGKTSQTDGLTGTIFGRGTIELQTSTPYIDFNSGDSTNDFDARIICSSDKTLEMNAATGALSLRAMGGGTIRINSSDGNVIINGVSWQSILDRIAALEAKLSD